ncbi:MAG: TIGR03067 domain-containing protein [Phenylobacterium sp.]
MGAEDLERLQGEWRVIGLEIDGGAIPPAMVAAARIRLNGDRFVSSGMGADYEGVLSLDPAAEPKRFTLTFQAGPEAGRANHGLYELEGDRWRFCLDMTGGPAPDGFATTPGSGRALQTLERVA